MKKIILYIVICAVPNIMFGQAKDSLTYYLEFALKHNPGIQAEYKAYEASLEKIPQFKSLSDPTISFGYFVIPAETRVGPQRAKLSVTQMFPWFGTLDAKGKQAAYSAQANYFKFISLRNKLEYKVKKDYYNLFLIKKSKDIIRQQIQIFENLEKQALIKSETGQSSIAEVLRFQMAKDELANKLKNLKIKEENTRIQFNLLLNRERKSVVFIPDSIQLIKENGFTEDTVLMNNPMVKRYEELIKYSDYALKESKLAAYPKIGVGLDYVFVGERQDINPEGNGKDIIMPMISMSIPLYRKKYKAKIKESELNKEEYNYKKKALENDLISEYEISMDALQTAFNDYKLYKELIIKADQALRILKTAYQTSGNDYDQVLNLENKVLEYRLAVLKASVDMKISESYLDYLSNQ